MLFTELLAQPRFLVFCLASVSQFLSDALYLSTSRVNICQIKKYIRNLTPPRVPPWGALSLQGLAGVVQWHVLAVAVGRAGTWEGSAYLPNPMCRGWCVFCEAHPAVVETPHLIVGHEEIVSPHGEPLPHT